ncbi:hypothetical protein ACFX19_035403 [Malus domestica]
MKEQRNNRVKERKFQVEKVGLTESEMGGRKTSTGSFEGSMKETEEVLEFCKEKGLTTTIEVDKMDYINTAFERVEKTNVRYRFIVDAASSNLDQ